MPREPWFQRTFAFDLPVARFPLLLERLRGTPVRVEDRTRDLTPATLTKSIGDRWSIQENVGHLLDLESLWLRRTGELLAGAAELTAADLDNRKTHQARHNEAALAELLADFRVARHDLLARLATADDAALARSAMHPRLRTPMRLIDLLLFVAEHDDHHLATITELRLRLGVE